MKNMLKNQTFFFLIGGLGGFPAGIEWLGLFYVTNFFLWSLCSFDSLVSCFSAFILEVFPLFFFLITLCKYYPKFYVGDSKVF